MTIEVTFRTVKGSTFKLPAEDSDTVLDLKRKVASHQSVDDFAAYRLIHKGKILQDDATLTSANITATGFVVVMPPKKFAAAAAATKKPAPPPTTTSPTAPTTTTTPTTAAAAPSSSEPATADESKEKPKDSTPPASTSAAATPSSASALVTGSEYDESIKRICEMGFAETEVKKAMRAAFNNPDRAVDYLFSGIPEMPETQPTTTPASSTNPSTTTASNNPPSSTPSTTNRTAPAAPPRQQQPFDMFGVGGGAAAPGGRLDFLRELPFFGHIRRLVQANPAALPQILQQLSTLNPDLIPLIEANQEEFSRLINEPLREGEGITEEAMEQMAHALGADGAPAPGGGGPQQQHIVVSEEEQAQINRLSEFASSIGVERQQVLETWLACNRDETLTANFLFDNAEELRAENAEDQQRQNASNNDNDNATDTNNDQQQGGDSESSPDRPPS